MKTLLRVVPVVVLSAVLAGCGAANKSILTLQDFPNADPKPTYKIDRKSINTTANAKLIIAQKQSRDNFSDEETNYDSKFAYTVNETRYRSVAALYDNNLGILSVFIPRCYVVQPTEIKDKIIGKSIIVKGLHYIYDIETGLLITNDINDYLTIPKHKNIDEKTTEFICNDANTAPANQDTDAFFYYKEKFPRYPPMKYVDWQNYMEGKAKGILPELNLDTAEIYNIFRANLFYIPDNNQKIVNEFLQNSVNRSQQDNFLIFRDKILPIFKEKNSKSSIFNNLDIKSTRLLATELLISPTYQNITVVADVEEPKKANINTSPRALNFNGLSISSMMYKIMPQFRNDKIKKIIEDGIVIKGDKK